MRPPQRLAILLPALVFAACLLLSPQLGDHRIQLEAGPGLDPYLDALVTESPLPAGWLTTARGGSYSLRLMALPADEEPPGGAYDCGIAHRVAAVDLGDPRYSVSKAEAESLGVEDIETVEPPRRALAVDGLWPGEKGYALDARLAIVLRPASPMRLRVPAELSSWMQKAAALAKERARSSEPFTLVAAGDLQVGRAQWRLLSSGEAGLEELVSPDILSLLRSGSVAAVNLESAISAGGEPNPRKRYRFLMPPGSSAALASAGFDVLLLANNHGLDYGESAFLDTLGELEKSGPLYVGAGRDLAEASAPRYVEAGSSRLAFVGYAFFPRENLGFSRSEAAAGEGKPGIAADLEATVASIREAAASGATVVVLAHGGTEYQALPDQSARSTYASFVDAGATLVLGSHPHLLQGCEARSGSLIAYSLGNFLFTDEDEPTAARRSAVLEFLLCGGKVRGLRLHPILVEPDGTRPDPDAAGAERLFSAACEEISSGDRPAAPR